MTAEKQNNRQDRNDNKLNALNVADQNQNNAENADYKKDHFKDTGKGEIRTIYKDDELNNGMTIDKKSNNLKKPEKKLTTPKFDAQNQKNKVNANDKVEYIIDDYVEEISHKNYDYNPNVEMTFEKVENTLEMLDKKPTDLTIADQIEKKTYILISKLIGVK